MTARKPLPREWPYECVWCDGGWCVPAAEMLASSDPRERGNLLVEAFAHATKTPAVPVDSQVVEGGVR